METNRPRLKGRVGRRRSARASIIALALIVLMSLPVSALSFNAFSPMNQPGGPGFGNSANSYSWSMAWFNGKLYVGTARNEMCVEYATYAFYGIKPYSTNPAPGVTCPANPLDMDLRAEIWQYTPRTNTWLRVYQSPTVPIPGLPGRTIARDIAYRGMVVYQNQLYVLGVTADEILPQMATSNPPRILRTGNGTSFTPVNGSIPTIQYIDVRSNTQQTWHPMGYRSFAVYNNRLFVTATPSLTGDGALVEIKNPAGRTPTFTQVSPWDMQIFELNTFNNQLYIGGASQANGYFVARTTAAGSPYTFTPIVTNGAGRGKDINSVVSMSVYDNRLYVGASGWYIAAAASELIRVNPDDSWNLVVGRPRMTDQGYKVPVSGLSDGFGNPFNAHFWRMQTYNGGLMVGTNDTSWLLSGIPLADLLLGWQYGYDTYYTCDGNSWFPMTYNAFGTGPYNFGARSMAASSTAAYIGSANQAQGTVEYSSKNDYPFWCQAPLPAPAPRATTATAAPKRVSGATPSAASSADATAAVASATLEPMTGVEADVLTHSTAVSWDPVAGAVKYHVYRSDYVSNKDLQLVPAQQVSQLVGDLAIPPAQNDPSGGSADIWIPGPFHEIGTTTDSVYLDTTAQAGGHYAYYVQYEDAQGSLSAPSNVAEVPSDSPVVDFASVAAMIQDLASRGSISAGVASTLTADLNQAQASWTVGSDVPDSLFAMLDTLQQNSGQSVSQQAAEDLSLQINKLIRQLQLAPVRQQDQQS